MKTAGSWVSQAEYAEAIGVAPSSVRRMVRDGRIQASNGKINRRAADKARAENTDLSKPRNSVTGNPRANGKTKGSATYAASRALRESYQAKIKALEYQELTGALVRVEAVKAAWFLAARRSRDLVQAIPDRLAPVLAAVSEAAEVHRLLAEELRRACEELSREHGR